MTHSDTPTENMAENLTDTARRTAEDLKETGRDALEGAKAAMSGAMSDLRAGAAAKADEVREVIAEEGERMAQSLREAAGKQGGGMQGRVLETMASGVHAVSDTIRSRDMATLMSDVQAFAKRNPALFIAGAAVTGLVLARLAAQAGRSDEDGGIGSYGRTGVQAGDMGAGLQGGGMSGAGYPQGGMGSAGAGSETAEAADGEDQAGGMIDDAMGGAGAPGKRPRRGSGQAARGDDLPETDIERGPSMGGNL